MVREHFRLSTFLSFRRSKNRSISSVKYGTPLLGLSDALLIKIASNLDPKDISHFLLANRRLAELLTPTLYDISFLDFPYDHAAASALCRASKLGHVKVVERLLDRGVSMIDLTHWTGIENPLHIAAREGQIEVVRAMLKHEDGNKAAALFDTYGHMPFHLAALNGFASVSKLFLEVAGVNINVASDIGITMHGATALHYAASWGHERVVRLLLGRGALPDGLTKDGAANTPLEWALQNFCSMSACNPIDPSAIIIRFLAHGANINRRNSAGRSLLHFAATSGDYSPQRRFGEHYSKIRVIPAEGILLPRDVKGRRDVAKALHKRVVALLIENGADINARDNEGKTPLYHAAEHGEDHFVRNFAELGADVGIKAASGETAIEMVVEKHLCGEGMEMVEALLDNGATINLGRGSKAGIDMVPREREVLMKFVKCHEGKMKGGGGPTRRRAGV